MVMKVLSSKQSADTARSSSPTGDSANKRAEA